MNKDEIKVPHKGARTTFQGTPCFAQERLAFDVGYREGYYDAISQQSKISSNTLLPAVAWEAIADDDFVFRKDEYCLRVEQMDNKIWWWCVYKDKNEIGSSWDSVEYNAKTEKEAKQLAELCFVRAWASNGR